MAENDQKTFDPTDKKIEDARRKGDTPSAPEMRHAAMFAGALVACGYLGVTLCQALLRVCTAMWSNAEDLRMTPATAPGFATWLVSGFGAMLAPCFATFIAVALIGGMVSGRPSMVWSRVAPQGSRIAPWSGAKRIFGKRALVEFAKTLAKLSGVLLIEWGLLRHDAIGVTAMVGAGPATFSASIAGLVYGMLRSVAMLVAALAVFDLVYQRRSWFARMRMSLQEIKDEYKQSEGDPKIKAKMRAIGAARSRKRMMAAVPNASVVVTNPTHYAVALHYEHGKSGAPRVVAKGTDLVALRIREIAAENGVPILERPPLARALFASCDVDRPIPIEHYGAVAEVIGFVLNIARQRGGR